ncbi:MAG: UDP-2,3-diacylglucosamine diphosphatase [Pseudomonadaceae bacterium]|nr:UDP-2,3-diacylglucosamine diphosphatase [Pseudomonadaceae bacterium]
MRRLFVSDLHLDSPDSRHALGFRNLIDRSTPDLDELYLLGDITEAWIGDDDDSPMATFLRECLISASKQCRVYLMHGNRDFLYGDKLSADTGVTLMEDVHQLDDGTLLCHGDSLCTDDSQYQQLRIWLRSPAFAEQLAGMSLAERRTLAGQLRGASSRETANKASNITDVNATAVRDLLRRYKATRLIHGHTHRPGIHTVDGTERIVIGDWNRCGWHVSNTGGRYELQCLPLAGAPL